MGRDSGGHSGMQVPALQFSRMVKAMKTSLPPNVVYPLRSFVFLLVLNLLYPFFGRWNKENKMLKHFFSEWLDF